MMPDKPDGGVTHWATILRRHTPLAVFALLFLWALFIIGIMVDLLAAGERDKAAAWLSGMLTPTVAILAVYIAGRQWQTAHERVRLDLFDRRYAVFEAVERLIGQRLAEGRLKLQDDIAFGERLAPARMLFPKEVATEITRVQERIARLNSLEASYPSNDGPERERQGKAITAAREGLRSQAAALPDVFAPYVRFDTL